MKKFASIATVIALTGIIACAVNYYSLNKENRITYDGITMVISLREVKPWLLR